jgi:hypothetical protein
MSITRSLSMCPSGNDSVEVTGYEGIPSPAKKKVLAPPMHYDLREADAAYVYAHLKELTKNDVTAAAYLEQIKPTLYATQRPLVFGYIPAPPNADVTRKVIGMKGYFFKMTTTLCGVHFIWHDTEINTFLLWGPTRFKVVKAMNSIRWRIVKYYDEINTTQASINEEANDDEADDDEDYSDMPALISCGNTPEYEHSEPF